MNSAATKNRLNPNERFQLLSAISRMGPINPQIVEECKLEQVVERISNASLPFRKTQNIVVSFSTNRHYYFIKQIRYPESIAIAELFYRQQGFAIPKSQFFSSLSEAAEHISTVFREKMIGIDDQNRWDSLKKQWDGRSATYAHLMITSKVTGQPFSLLEPVDIVDALEDQNLCRELGKMIFADDLIGNRDRLNDNTCNFGNFLLILNEDDGSRSIGLIDHELDISEDRGAAWLAQISTHLAGSFSSIVDELIDRSIQQIESDEILMNRLSQSEFGAAVATGIEEGYREATAQFLQDFREKQDFLNFFPTSKIADRDRFDAVMGERYETVHVHGGLDAK